MIHLIQNRFALTRDGAITFVKAVVWSLLLNLAFMLPAIYLFLYLTDYLDPLIHPGATPSHGLGYYILIGLLCFLVIFVIAFKQYASAYTKIYTESAERRIALAEKLRKLPLAFFGERNLSDLTSTIMADCSEIEHVFSHAVPQLFAAAGSILLITIGLFFYNWQLSLALFWVVPLALLVLILSKRSLERELKGVHCTNLSIAQQIQEGLESVQEIKAYNGEEEYLKTFDETITTYERQLMRGETLAGSTLNLSHILLKLGIASVILVGAYLLADGTIPMLTYLIFLIVSASIYNPIMEVMNNFAALLYLDVRINRFREMDQMPIQTGVQECHPKGFDIAFDGVEFSYETGKQVLRGVSFVARQGEVTALVGPSGGGKSTTAKLAARFWDVDQGCITLGGEDISKIDPETLLQYYSVVFQDVLLFNASIADNIRVGRKDASDEEVRRVARLAQCEEFIQRMPQGYDTQIGENGETLSGGERQRISIARALLKDAPIVLLDEATASLDVENESKIQTAISALIKDKTVLIIAHRMRTVAHAHKIVVIKEGQVVEMGAPEELLAQGGEFTRMVAAQNA